MLRQSPARNQRSKGIKVRHVLQICLLLAVCFWLIYQVKHSHDKKREFDENDAKISLNTREGDEIIKFGRKDPHLRVEETTTKVGKHDEEAEDENGGEEENKHDEEAQEEENKTEELEVDGIGGGDDEIDERDQEKHSIGDFIDEEKEGEEDDDEKDSEEKDSEDTVGQMENENSLEDDHDGGAESVHEAREENYKADDASSAVTHETQTISTEGETGSFENSDDKAATNVLEQELKVNNPEESSSNQNTTRAMVEDGETTGTGASTNAIFGGEKSLQANLSESLGGLVLNSTFKGESIDQPEQNNNSTEVSAETHDLLLHNGTDSQTDLSQAQNATLGTISSNQGTIKLDQINGSTVASVIAPAENILISNTNENQEEIQAKSSTSSISVDATVSEDSVDSDDTLSFFSNGGEY